MHGPEAKVNNDKDLFDHNDNYEGVATFPRVQLLSLNVQLYQQAGHIPCDIKQKNAFVNHT